MVSANQGNLSPIFIEGRRKMLEEFIRCIATRSYMYQSDEFQMFLRGNDNYEKSVSQTKSPSFPEIGGVYQSIFAEHRKTLPVDSETKLDNYTGFFKGLLAKLKALKEQTKGTVNCFNAFSRNYWTMCDNLQEFETNYIAQYFQGDYQQIFKSLNRESFVNPFEVLQNLLKVEDLEVSAMLDCFIVKKNYEGILKRLNGKLASDQKDLAKLSAGKKTLGSLFSSKPKPAFIQNLTETIDATKSDIQSVEQILNIITVRLLEYEVPVFLKMRANTYEKALRSFGRVTVKEFEEIIKVCKHLADS